MKQFIIIGRPQACSVIGGAASSEGRVVRMLGRLVGAALRAIYDLLTMDRRPQAAGSW